MQKIGLRLAVVLLVASRASASGVTVKMDPKVKARVRAAVGDDAIDCGVYPGMWYRSKKLAPDILVAVRTCISEARRRGRAFSYSIEGYGIDSYVASGLVGERGGRVQRFVYDSAPCGGPSCKEAWELCDCKVAKDTATVDPEMTCGWGEEATANNEMQLPGLGTAFPAPDRSHKAQITQQPTKGVDLDRALRSR
jgi:hypothetical protein